MSLLRGGGWSRLGILCALLRTPAFVAASLGTGEASTDSSSSPTSATAVADQRVQYHTAAELWVAVDTLNNLFTICPTATVHLGIAANISFSSLKGSSPARVPCKLVIEAASDQLTAIDFDGQNNLFEVQPGGSLAFQVSIRGYLAISEGVQHVVILPLSLHILTHSPPSPPHPPHTHPLTPIPPPTHSSHPPTFRAWCSKTCRLCLPPTHSLLRSPPPPTTNIQGLVLENLPVVPASVFPAGLLAVLVWPVNTSLGESSHSLNITDCTLVLTTDELQYLSSSINLWVGGRLGWVGGRLGGQEARGTGGCSGRLGWWAGGADWNALSCLQTLWLPQPLHCSLAAPDSFWAGFRARPPSLVLGLRPPPAHQGCEAPSNADLVMSVSPCIHPKPFSGDSQAVDLPQS